MYRLRSLIAIILLLPIFSASSAQEADLLTAQSEHELLKRFAGDWRFERRGTPGDGSESQIFGEGIVSAELVGEFFVLSRWSGEVFGMDYKAFQSLGYDIQKNEYTGSWGDSIMSFRWELSGKVDEESEELIVMTSGPGPTGGIARFRERYQFDSADSITIIGQMQQGEEWATISTTRLTRKTSVPEEQE